MLSEYRAQRGQSLSDICLNVYGTTDYLYKMLTDSQTSSLDYEPKTGDVFYYDTALTVNVNTSRTKVVTPVRYSTFETIDMSGLPAIFNNNYN